MTASVRESIDEVGSSRIRIGASLRNARATRDALALAAGELRAALADHGVVAVRQRAR